MIPKSYVVNNSCGNCKHAFVMFNYDDPDQFFCHKDKSPRPLCGSVGMDESYCLTVSDKERTKLDKLWDKWSDSHSVSVNGYCEEHEDV